MKTIFVAVGTMASQAVIELAKRCRDENLDKDGMLAQDFKYVTLDNDPWAKCALERLYPDTNRVRGIHLTSEAKDSPVLESLLAVRGDWRVAFYHLDNDIYSDRRRSAATRTWVAELRQCFEAWGEDEMEVFIVGTACGATCSGMYWDVAGCLRSWCNPHTTVSGVVCLSDLDAASIKTPYSRYPIPRNFCAFMQDMRQIAILNSLRNAGAGHCFRPLSFKEIETEASTRRWEDCRIPVYGKKDIRMDTSRLPVDAAAKRRRCEEEFGGPFVCLC